MKVSIVIPVYNAEKFLKETLDSCIAQTEKDIEILLIDDCSTDKSSVIMREYAEKYDFIKNYWQEKNQKAGAARNVGIKNATGEYIMFLDSDDWISEDACELLYKKAAETKADMIAGNYQVVYPDKAEDVNVYSACDFGELTYEKRALVISQPGLHISRIYRREFLTENEIFYPENMYFEDSVFNSLTILLAKDIYKVDTTFYFYRMNETSATHINPENFYHSLDVGEHLIEEAERRGILNKYKEIISGKVLSNYYIALSSATAVRDEKAKMLLYKIKRSYNKIKKEQILNVDEANKLLKLNSLSPKLLLLYCKFGRIKAKWKR